MFCKKCGKQIADNSTICAACGAQIDPAASAGQDNTHSGTEGSAFISLNTEGQSTKKKKKWLIPTLVTSGILVIALVVGLIFWLPTLQGTAERAAKSPEELNVDVNKAAFSDTLKSFGDLFDSLFSSANGNYKGEVHIGVNRDIAFLVSSQVDLQWLSDIQMTYDINSKDSLSRLALELSMGDTYLASANYVMDKENREMWLNIPDLSDQALYYSLSETMTGSDTASNTVLAAVVYEMLPSWDAMEQPVTDAVDTFLKGFKNVKESKETVEIEKVSQEVTVLKGQMTREELYEVLIAILEQFKSDESVKNLLKDMEESYGEDVKLQDAVNARIDEIIDGIEKELDSDDFDKDGMLYMSTYLNSKNEIVGHKFETTFDNEEKTLLSYMMVVNGTDMGLELICGDDLQVTGSGEMDKTFSGTFVLMVQEQEYAEIKLVNYDFEKECDNGIIMLTPMDALMEDVLEVLPLAESIENIIRTVSVVIEIETTGTTAKNTTDIRIKAAGMEAATIVISGEETSAQEIAIPENAVNAGNDRELQQWRDGLDVEGTMDTLIARLTKAGLPLELLLMLGYSGMEMPF